MGIVLGFTGGEEMICRLCGNKLPNKQKNKKVHNKCQKEAAEAAKDGMPNWETGKTTAIFPEITEVLPKEEIVETDISSDNEIDRIMKLIRGEV